MNQYYLKLIQKTYQFINVVYGASRSHKQHWRPNFQQGTKQELDVPEANNNNYYLHVH